MDDAHDVCKQWDEVLQDGGAVIDHINNDVQVVTESNPGGLTTKWDQAPLVSPTVSTAAAEVKVSPTDTGQLTRERKPPNQFFPSWTGKKFVYAMTQIIKLDGCTVKELVAFMQQQLMEAGEHQQPEVIGSIVVQLSMKAEFGVARTEKACRVKLEQIHMRKIFVPKHWEDLTP